MSARTLAAATAVLTSGCISHSLHSPRPLDSGEVQLGVHVGSAAAVATEEAGDSVEVAGLTLTGTGRFGLGNRFELGVDAGTLGASAAAKYGFFEHDDPLQVSVLGSVGAYVWSVFDASVAGLVGYTLGDVVTPYVGYRQHVYVAGAALWAYRVIAGVEFEFGSGVGLMLEANLAQPVDFGTDGDDDAVLLLVAFSGGLTVTF